MDRNPYAPPNAAVVAADVTVPGSRPSSVARAVWLLWASFVFNLLAAFVQPQRLVPVISSLFLLIFVAMAALWAWFVGKISRGRNWARIVLLVLTIFGYFWLPLTWNAQLAMMQMSTAYAILDVAVHAANLGALFLLFTRSANAWFRPGVSPVR